MVDLHTQELHRFTSYDNASLGQCSLRCSYVAKYQYKAVLNDLGLSFKSK